MQKKNLLLITGATGFIGSKILNQLEIMEHSYKILTFSSKKIFNYTNCNLLEITSIEFKKLVQDFDNVYLIHLATFFSLNKKDSEKIVAANEKFGYDLLKTIEGTNLRQIIYTNSLYLFSEDKIIKNSKYVETKTKFSIFLKEYTDQRSIYFSEIFIGNTFGSGDERPKLIPQIIDSVKNGNINPIKNPDAYINLVPVNVVVNEIINQISNESNRYSLISKYDYKISSIYEFCLNNFKKKKSKKIENKYSAYKNVLKDKIPILEFETNLEKELLFILRAG